MVMDQQMGLAAATGSLGSMEGTTCGSMNAALRQGRLRLRHVGAPPGSGSARQYSIAGPRIRFSACRCFRLSGGHDKSAKKTTQLCLLKGKFPQNGKVPRET